MQRQARGQALINVINLEPDERVTTCLPIATSRPGATWSWPPGGGRSSAAPWRTTPPCARTGSRRWTWRRGTSCAGWSRTGGTDELILVTARGQSLTFAEDVLRVSGRTSGGVRGIRLDPGRRAGGPAGGRPGGVAADDHRQRDRQADAASTSSPATAGGAAGCGRSSSTSAPGPWWRRRRWAPRRRRSWPSPRHAVVIRIPVESVKFPPPRGARGAADAGRRRGAGGGPDQDHGRGRGGPPARAAEPRGALALNGRRLGRAALGDGAPDGRRRRRRCGGRRSGTARTRTRTARRTRAGRPGRPGRPGRRGGRRRRTTRTKRTRTGTAEASDDDA